MLVNSCLYLCPVIYEHTVITLQISHVEKQIIAEAEPEQNLQIQAEMREKIFSVIER